MKVVLSSFIFAFFLSSGYYPENVLSNSLGFTKPWNEMSYGLLSLLYQKQMGPEVWRTLPYFQQKSEAKSMHVLSVGFGSSRTGAGVPHSSFESMP